MSLARGLLEIVASVFLFLPLFVVFYIDSYVDPER